MRISDWSSDVCSSDLHCVIDLATGSQASAVASTTVRYGTPTAAEMDAYLATEEPLAVAGGFTIDGYAAPFVDGIDGDHGTVLGLSLPLLRRLLAEIGLDRKSTRLNSSPSCASRMPSSACKK